MATHVVRMWRRAGGAKGGLGGGLGYCRDSREKESRQWHQRVLFWRQQLKTSAVMCTAAAQKLLLAGAVAPLVGTSLHRD
jgi:hypothetical protein